MAATAARAVASMSWRISDINTLVDYRYTRRFLASAANGGSADCYGKGGDDIILRVPVGTVI